MSVAARAELRGERVGKRSKAGSEVMRGEENPLAGREVSSFGLEF